MYAIRRDYTKKKSNGELGHVKEKICKGEFSYMVYWYY